MELVEGPTLADRIDEGAIPLDEALALARQIADSLEYAHEHGVIHRDLKPANVKVTEDGSVKVLDFGLAKAMAEESGVSDPENSPTLTIGATKAGVILGTAAYMAPEQARGKRVDKRADIWAFGVVLYEMLTARRLFAGEDLTDTLARVVRDEPDLSAAPAKVRPLLAKCLEKDPKNRLRDISGVALLLEAPVEPAPAARSSLLWPVAAAVLLVIASALVVVHFGESPPEGLLRKVEIGAALDVDGSDPFALSPDGQKVAYVSAGSLWIRDLAEFDAREVAGSEGALNPFWSPDSANLAYFAGGELWRVPLSGVGARPICDLPTRGDGDVAGGAWNSDGTILFTTGGTGLLSVPDTGGEPVAFVEVDPETEEDFHDASALPDGRGALFVVHRHEGVDSLAVSEGTGHKIILTVEGEYLSSPVYATSGHVFYVQERDNRGIWALPFSLSRLEATGEPFLAYPDAALPSTSWDGTIAILQRPNGARSSRLVWVSRDGEVSGATGVKVAAGLRLPALSPDGSRIAYTQFAGQDSTDVWVYDLAREVSTRISAGGEADFRPLWSPDGEQVAFASFRDNTRGIYTRSADGTGQEQLVETATFLLSDWSRNGRYLLFMAPGQGTGADIWFVERTEAGGWGEAQPLLAEPGNQLTPALSPDGRYFAYQSSETGRSEIYVRPFRAEGRRQTVSSNGGTRPRWSRDGGELFYVDGDGALTAVDVATEGELVLGQRTTLFQHPSLQDTNNGMVSYDMSEDGQQFLLPEPLETEAESPGISIIENWYQEFRERQ